MKKIFLLAFVLLTSNALWAKVSDTLFLDKEKNQCDIFIHPIQGFADSALKILRKTLNNTGVNTRVVTEIHPDRPNTIALLKPKNFQEDLGNEGFAYQFNYYNSVFVYGNTSIGLIHAVYSISEKMGFNFFYQ